MKNFSDIPVIINGRSHLFNFFFVKDTDGIVWIVNSEGHTLYINESLNTNNIDMPDDWIEPAVKALIQLLEK